MQLICSIFILMSLEINANYLWPYSSFSLMLPFGYNHKDSEKFWNLFFGDSSSSSSSSSSSEENDEISHLNLQHLKRDSSVNLGKHLIFLFTSMYIYCIWYR